MTTERFPCPKCGATEDEEGKTNWTALYYQPACQSVDLIVGPNGEPEPTDYGGDEDIIGDATENDTYTCSECANDLVVATLRLHDPKTIKAVDAAEELVKALRAIVNAPTTDRRWGAISDAEALLARINGEA